MNKFNPGDVVELISGSDEMTVINNTASGEVRWTWFARRGTENHVYWDGPYTQSFNENALKKVN